MIKTRANDGYKDHLDGQLTSEVGNLSSLVPAAAPSGIREHTRSAGSRAAPSGNLSPARGGIPFSPPPLDPSAQPVEQKSLFSFSLFLTFGTFSTTVLLT